MLTQSNIQSPPQSQLRTQLLAVQAQQQQQQQFSQSGAATGGGAGGMLGLLNQGGPSPPRFNQPQGLQGGYSQHSGLLYC